MDRPHAIRPLPPARLELRHFAGKHLKRNRSLRARALRALAGFLLLMLLFTLLSRAADEMTIPKVTAKEPEVRTIDRKVVAAGRVEELSARTIATQPGIRIGSIAVKPGSRVGKGDPLFTLDREDLEEKLAAAREELTRQELDLKDQQSRDALSRQDQVTTLSRAQQDYDDAKKSADREVAKAQKALEEAQKALKAYVPPAAPDLAALQAELDRKKAALDQAEKELSDAQERLDREIQEAREAAEADGKSPDDAERLVREQYEETLTTAKANVQAAQLEVQEAAQALEQAKSDPGDSQKEALESAVETARQAYELAVENRDASLKAAQRALEDAKRPSASDSTEEKSNMALEAQREQVAALETLEQEGGVVRSPEAGTITKLAVEVGSPTPEGMAALLADSAKGAVFTAQISSEQGKYLSPGDQVTLKPGSDKDPIKGLTVESVGKSAEDPEQLEVTVRLPEGTLEIGETASLEAVQQSREYNVCVPLSALHEENGVYYLLVPRETQGILGKQLTADRLNVSVLEKNESYAALDEMMLAPGQKYLISNGKKVEADDRIRLENS